MSRILATSRSSLVLSKTTQRWQAAHAALLGLLLAGPLLAAEEPVKEEPAAYDALVLEPTLVTAESTSAPRPPRAPALSPRRPPASAA